MNDHELAVPKVSVLVGRKRRFKHASAGGLPELSLYDLLFSEGAGEVAGYSLGCISRDGCAACYPYPCSCDFSTDQDAGEGLDSEDKDALPVRMGMGSGGKSEGDGTAPTCNTTWGFPPSKTLTGDVGREDLSHNESAENVNRIPHESGPGVRLPDEGICQTFGVERRKIDPPIKGIPPRENLSRSSTANELGPQVASGNRLYSGNPKCTNSAIALKTFFARKRQLRKGR